MQTLVDKTQKEITLEKRYVRKDGRVFWGVATISPLWGQGPLPEFYLAVVRDITVRKKAEEKLLLAAKVFENTVEGIVVTDPHGTIEQVNPGFTVITGYSADEAVGGNPRILKSDRHPQHFYSEMWARLDAGRALGRGNLEPPQERRVLSRMADHHRGEERGGADHQLRLHLPRHHRAQAPAGRPGIPGPARRPDRTAQPRPARRPAAHGPGAAERSGGKLALLFLDLDNFKTINDGLGHSVGDQLLVELSRRLENLLRSGDTLARLGGDEFLILLPEVESIDDASHIATRMLDALKKPFSHGDVEYFVTASIGLTIAPDDGIEGPKLIKNADMAMYRAKSMGRNNYQYFTPEMDVAAHRRISLEYKLRKAIEAQEFELFYQPLVNMDSGAILGAEALIRWRSEGKLVSPADFIPLAEDSGLILPLGDWVLRTAAHQARLWQDAGHDLTMSVNISSRQFAGADLAATLREVLLHTRNCDPVASISRSPNPCSWATWPRPRRLCWPCAKAGGTFFPRRFRHRLFVPVLSQAPAHRRTQDRPLLCAGHHRRFRQPRHCRGHRVHGPDPQPAPGCRGCRDAGATQPPGFHGPHRAAGISRQPARSGT
jgi:diguanylate cyclase (GGDEF)-like protein